MNIKTRFAPSPTGYLHIGNIRTALYAWLFARKQGGKFVLRIEDTNTVHLDNDEVIKNIISIMKWLRLDWDEGPYFQTKRLNRYNSIIYDMLQNNIAYRCFCSEERLSLLRLNQMKSGEKPKYDGRCRTICMFKNNAMLNTNRIIDSDKGSYVVRFCNPDVGKVSFYDQVRGMITFDNCELDDIIIQRSNGVPTYNFCVVVDDMDMNITHVVRGEEHINNTPRQINILKALRAEIPQYIHVPMILDQNRKKLSKRHGKSGIMQYRNDGFLPEAILNCLVRLGWSYGNQEIFSMDQMKKYFDFSEIHKSASVFDINKLMWFNHYYINHLPVNHIIKYLSEYIQIQNISDIDSVKLIDLVNLFSKRSHTLKEMIFNYRYLCKDFNIFEKKIAKKYLIPTMINPLKFFRKKLNNISNWTIKTVQTTIKETVHELNMNMNMVGMALRVALIGSDKSPSMSIVVYIIGKCQVLDRIDRAIDYINSLSHD
ncbi:glutamyl-tRNA synthetase [Candidatus Blochmanniella floridana]|uniref:Glutamate--tRNA ligase n=1 Tax=Blochmanniella floridana TaxID=203907 RepID=SYE_BLOFL|nr:RecName: Full=Glutamate--tRNA ligase; AltName: Full=Glutamyl-tRNA synthetase; Short=GluRS [Candidatus Blochmannia floridanus]CAD83192.1 glutamyl-tRNA synthetase [Candidatus Blochmannia floridanus]